jgi:hypothetical protein
MRVVVVVVLAMLACAPTVSAASADSSASRKRIVREWSMRLNAYDNVGAAKLFARPATFVQSGYVLQFDSGANIVLWHRRLPCAGRIVSITVRGEYATAVFVLRNGTHRPCDAPGAKAAAVFRIRAGKILSWTQIPVPTPSGPTA